MGGEDAVVPMISLVQVTETIYLQILNKGCLHIP